MGARPWHKAYETGVPTALDLEALTVSQFLERAATDHGDATAIIYFNRRLTYRQLKDHVDRFAGALAELGVTRDSRVAIQLPNIPQTVIAYYATLSLGAQAVMTNPLYTPRELEHQWKDAGCRVAVVTDFLFESRIREARARLPIEQYIVASIPDYMRLPLRFVARWKLGRADPPRVARVAPEAGVHSFMKLIRRTKPDSRTPARPDDLAALQYTGGTTGFSKGAMLTHANLAANLQQCRAWFSLSDGPAAVSFVRHDRRDELSHECRGRDGPDSRPAGHQGDRAGDRAARGHAIAGGPADLQRDP